MRRGQVLQKSGKGASRFADGYGMGCERSSLTPGLWSEQLGGWSCLN